MKTFAPGPTSPRRPSHAPGFSRESRRVKNNRMISPGLCLTSNGGHFQVKAKVKGKKARVEDALRAKNFFSTLCLPLQLFSFALLLLPFTPGFCYSLRR